MNILGVSGGFGHDPAACLVRNGQLVAAAEEERFVRRKAAPDTPAVRSALYCLDAGGVEFGEVDYIVFSWDPAKDTASKLPADRARALLEHPAIRGRHRAEVVFVDHHLAHAAASYYTSGLERAGVVVTDGRGEVVSTTLLVGSGRSLEPVWSAGINHSLGFFYEAAAKFVGLGIDEPGKLMGLAPYGVAEHDVAEVVTMPGGYRTPIVLPDDLGDGGGRDQIFEQWMAVFVRAFGPPAAPALVFDPVSGRLRSTAAVFERRRADAAAAVQRTLERVLAHLAELACQEAGSRNLVLSGGVALNCTANGRLRRSGRFEDIYVFAAAGDPGGAVGAALEVAARHAEPPPGRIRHPYWGPGYEAGTIAEVLRGSGLEFEEPREIWAAVGERLLAGEVGGWFQGRAEFGPRALGHRSILAAPGLRSVAERTNQIKGREWWRPLAPSMTPGTAARTLGVHHETPFMLEAALVQEEWRDELQGVTHVDGSTRPQTVNSDTDPAYVQLLAWLERATGLGAVLNTSFNVAGEPIVCTPADAVRSFYASALDFLAIGPMLLRKRRR